MAALRVDTTMMGDQVTQFQSLLQSLEDISSDVAAVNKQLQWRSSLSSAIRSNLSQHSDYVRQLKDIASSLSGALSSAAEQYTTTENSLIETAQSTANSIVATVAGAGGGADGDGGSSWSDADYTSALEDYLDLLKTLFGAAGKLGEDATGASLLGKLFGTMSSLISLICDTDSSTTFAEWVEKLTSLSKNGTGAISKFLKLLGLDTASSTLGLSSSTLGLIKTLFGNAGATAEEMVSSINDFVDDAGGFADSYLSLTDTVFSEGSTWNKMCAVTAVTSLMTAAVRFGGSTYLYCQDGVYDFNDFDNSLIDGSTAGLAALVKGVTFGVVDVDADNAISTYKDYATYIGNVIGQYDLPTGVKIGLSAGGGAVAFVAGTVDIAVDTAKSTVETVSGAVSYVWNAVKWW